MKFIILVDLSLAIITSYLYVGSMPGSREEGFFLKKYINFTLFAPKLPPFGRGGHEIQNSLSSYPTEATYQIWLRLVKQFLRRRC